MHARGRANPEQLQMFRPVSDLTGRNSLPHLHCGCCAGRHFLLRGLRFDVWIAWP